MLLGCVVKSCAGGLPKMLKRKRQLDDSRGTPDAKSKLDSLPVVKPHELGAGTPKNPFHLPLREKENASGCFHCFELECCCAWFTEQLRECFDSIAVKRQVQPNGRRELCAKSVLPQFVSRLVRIARLQRGEVFYDLGCGNGSVLFQVAAMTGAPCVGIEINPHNAQLATEAWRRLQPIIEKRFQRKLHVEIICADFCEVLQSPTYFSASSVIWAANLLLPRPVNHYLSERFRRVPSGTRVFCFEDLFPHSRSLSKIRDPEAFEKFIMYDYRWQEESVEWCSMEGPFYMYVRRDA